MTSILWYPGRVPLCASEVAWLLTQLIENVTRLVKTQDGVLLDIIDTICKDAQQHLMSESEACLHTDDTLKELLEYFQTTAASCHALYYSRTWDGLAKLAVIAASLRCDLEEEIAKSTENAAPEGETP